MIRVVVTGSKGRMGSRVISLIKSSGDLTLAAEIDKEDSLADLLAARNSGVDFDVIVDFTTADAAACHAVVSARYDRPIVIGTTGLSEVQQIAVREAATAVPVVFAPNMSIGVNVMFRLVEIASRSLGMDYKVDIVETHHIHKKDRPSGTAKKILDIVLEGTGRCIGEDVLFYEEETPISDRKSRGADISVRSVRKDEVVGDHVIHFTGPGETLSIHHSAATRGIFAEGALAAARWIVGKPAGLYGMDDVLGLQEAEKQRSKRQR